MKEKTRLLGSSATFEGIRKLISEYFFTKKIELVMDFPGRWTVWTHTGPKFAFLVRRDKGRYRFEERSPKDNPRKTITMDELIAEAKKASPMFDVLAQYGGYQVVCMIPDGSGAIMTMFSGGFKSLKKAENDLRQISRDRVLYFEKRARQIAKDEMKRIKKNPRIDHDKIYFDVRSILDEAHKSGFSIGEVVEIEIGLWEKYYDHAKGGHELDRESAMQFRQIINDLKKLLVKLR